ncbi:MAG TPA: universal stress protein [Candidatus Acidoferrales bacterium]|nr:universal stress protein [Candidatus Acidoferrales bacterium]
MRILLATDLSPESEIAQTLVMGMPLPAGSHIRAVYAIEQLSAAVTFGVMPVPEMPDDIADDARRELAKIARTLQRACVTIETAARIGRAADVIVDESVSFAPDLIVMGNRGRGAIASTILGSVSAEVIDRASAPVLIARRPTLASVVLAEDGSDSAAAGARFISAYAPFANTAVHVVSVTDVPFPVVLADPTGTSTAVDAYETYQMSVEATRARQEAVLAARLLALRGLRIATTGERREGDAASELIAAAAARRADCIVIGSRGQTGLRRFVLGSVARSVLHHAPCSVLVAHAPVITEPADRELVSSSGREVLA